MSHSILHRSGIREINFDLTDESVAILRYSWQKFINELGGYPKSNFKNKGIVICGGGVRYFTCAWVAIKQLRRLGCNLPVEVWFLEGEFFKELNFALDTLNATCRIFDPIDCVDLQGVSLKPLAIARSHFEEVLFLDADNNCIKDPTFLFNSEAYKKFGAVFWPDYWKTASDNPIWKVVEANDLMSNEQESGQIVINKRRCWNELNLCLYFNRNHMIYHKLLHGDKDTFKFAWYALKTEFFMVEKDVATCGFFKNHQFLGNTMVQHSFDDSILFFHRNLLKWDITRTHKYAWQYIKEFSSLTDGRNYLCDGYSMDIKGDLIEYVVPDNIVEVEEYCLASLEELRKDRFYIDYVNR